MGYTVKSVLPDGSFEIMDGKTTVVLKYKTEAEERAEKNLGEDKYLEASVMFNYKLENGNVVGLQPFWAIFEYTTPEKLEKALAKAIRMYDPVEHLKTVTKIRNAMDDDVKIGSILLLGSGSMHVGGACVCCQHPADHALDQIAEAMVLSKFFKIPLSIQDPAYSRMEKEFLTSKGIKVLDDPDAFATIDYKTVVLARGVWFSLFHKISEGNFPGIFITCNVPACIRQEDSPVSAYDQEIIDMFEEYDRKALHDEELDECWREEGNHKKKGLAKREAKKELRKAKNGAPCVWVPREPFTSSSWSDSVTSATSG